jgi:hypothetical protein
MLELASVDSFAVIVLQWVAWSNVGVAVAFAVGVFAVGVCCGVDCLRDRRKARLHGIGREGSDRRSGNGECSTRTGGVHGILEFRPMTCTGCSRNVAVARLISRRPKTVFLLLVVALAACVPRLVHLDGQPLTPIAPPLSLGNGWLAIDSCELGRHAVVEIQFETSEPRVRASDSEALTLRIGIRQGWKVGRVRVEDPVCWERTPNWARDRVRDPWRDGGASFRSVVEPRCVYVVHAQFDLDRLPTSGDSIAVLHGKRFVRVAWR